MRALVYGAATALALAAAPAAAQQSQFEKYQKMVAEGSPVELFELSGEELWKKKQGPRQASLEKCDLGKGPGVLKGAYAALPRYFKDVDRVMDLETRLLHCMTTLQGRTREEATKRLFGDANQPSEMEYLSAYVAGQSRGTKLAPGAAHPKEKEAYELGKTMFFYRTGAWDFSCASCHGEAGKRIRMSELPVLSEPKAARPLMATWPAYRVSNSTFVTMQWRINDCYRQMRTPEPNFGSETTVALITYLTVTAKGEAYRGPGTKR
ncbi:MAG: sulfur oxidation c-type cytochrome SoxA [Betaproteobacteria bacterium RIFCSPHIGHO2_12_FULL_69_13]|nr:MAG: sulfur oxidation c-type cytochrome SoxA [Betaproteobacteria bacterium RIFCSPHIGHO2_12_FULL_69_13]OGA71153.1 MAG: sulfur oxidation c-type cytochrome SoxA [Betaproteobacteria bacterium RIFCSPLOWO2_12_FULL_68_20]